MKLLIASDIHGDFESANALIEKYKKHNCDKILLLGDILYHGPRNDLPSSYAPKKVIPLLNEHKNVILAVRGNCDAEVDQMVLDFPILAEYIHLSVDGLDIFATHGHRHNTATPPNLGEGTILLHGHTHIPKIEPFGSSNTYINPGSVALPKDGNPRTYIVYENRCFTLFDLDDVLIKNISF